MSNIITKPAGVKFSKEKVSFEMIFDEPYYIGVAYTDGKKIQIKKFVGNNAALEAGWQELEKLTEYPFIAFFGNKYNKVIEKNNENLCPISLGDCAYVAAGEILNLRKKTRKQFTDAFYFKQYAFDEMEQACPSLFLHYQGRWLLHRIISRKAAMAFLSKDGKFSVVNHDGGYEFEKMWYFDNDCVNMKTIVPPLIKK